MAVALSALVTASMVPAAPIASMTSAATPATWGAAADVPQKGSRTLVETQSTPVTSGLGRAWNEGNVIEVGPAELYGSISVGASASVAATVRTSGTVTWPKRLPARTLNSVIAHEPKQNIVSCRGTPLQSVIWTSARQSTLAGGGHVPFSASMGSSSPFCTSAEHVVMAPLICRTQRS